MSGDLFFLVRDGFVWAGWLSGKPAVQLGDVESVRSAIGGLIADLKESKPGGVPPSPELPRVAAPLPSPPSPPLPRRAVVNRVEPRHETTIFGRVFTVGGSREVTVHDLSERGCRFTDATATLSPGTRCTIKLGPVGPLEAEVKWREGAMIGVAFATPLYPSVMAHIRESFSLRR